MHSKLASLDCMDNARSEAYGRVVKTVADMGPTKLSADEQQTIRTAADALFFDGDGYDELAAVEDLVQQLVDADRWRPSAAASSSTTSPPAAPPPAFGSTAAQQATG